ncbi:MAG: putative Ig domain-containing protein [Acetobacter sp.]|nr:putative Ig domain-containing protein [Acetobacter sp.]
MLILGSPAYGFKDHFYGFMPLILGGRGGETSLQCVSGVMPAGLSLSSSGNYITGTPLVCGPTSFTLKVVDGVSSAYQSFMINILA